MNNVRTKILLGLLVFIVVTVASLRYAKSEELTQEACVVYANFSMKVATLRDQGVSADLIYRAATGKGGLPRDFVVLTILAVYHKAPDVTPEGIGKAFYTACLNNVPAY